MNLYELRFANLYIYIFNMKRETKEKKMIESFNQLTGEEYTLSKAHSASIRDEDGGRRVSERDTSKFQAREELIVCK